MRRAPEPSTFEKYLVDLFELVNRLHCYLLGETKGVLLWALAFSSWEARMCVL